MNKVYPDQFLGVPSPGRDKADAIILPLPLEMSVSFGRGTWRGPRAIIDASCEVELFDEETLLDFTEYPLVHTEQAVVPDLDAGVKDYLDAVRDHVAGLPRAFLLSLGGEHSVTWGAVMGLARNGRMPHIVQIDAHADLIDVLNGEKWSHGAVMRRLVEEGCPVTQIGIRSLSRDEYDFSKDSTAVETFYAWNLPGRWDELMERLRGLDGDIYLTVDVDGLDPAVIPSTGTTQPDGLSWRQTMDIIRTVCAAPRARLIGADVVEYIACPHPPSYDIVAARLVMKILAFQAAAHR